MDITLLRKFLFLGIFTNIIRLVRFFPNNDPIMGSMMPFSRYSKWWHTFLYVIIIMVSFDIMTGRLGIWTIGTSVTYGLIALISTTIFKRIKKISMKKYFGFGIIFVLIFDIITGPMMSSFLFPVSFTQALIGQIPFTLMHLAGSMTYIIILCPILDPQINQDYNILRHLSNLKEWIIKEVPSR